MTKVSNGIYNIGYEEDWIDPFERGEYDGQGEGRGLIYFNHPDDPGTNYSCGFYTEQTNMITVYNDSMTVISGYAVDYLKGRVLYSGPETLSYIDYSWHYVSVVDAWPYEAIPQLPIVSVMKTSADRSGLQLGAGHIRSTDWNVQIFANDKGERDDLIETIFDGLYLRSCPFYDFSNGSPLDYDGTFNTNFDGETIDDYSSIDFDNVESSLTGLPDWGFYKTETLNKYRAEVTFSSMIYYL